MTQPLLVPTAMIPLTAITVGTPSIAACDAPVPMTVIPPPLGIGGYILLETLRSDDHRNVFAADLPTEDAGAGEELTELARSNPFASSWIFETEDVRETRSNPTLPGESAGRCCCWSKKVDCEDEEGKRRSCVDAERRREIWGCAAGRRGKAAEASDSGIEWDGVIAPGNVSLECSGDGGMEA